MIDELELSTGLLTRLRNLDLETIDSLTALNRRELLSLQGIGPRAVEAVAAALEGRGLALAADPYQAYVCARHDGPRGDAGLAGFWLCEECKHSFVTDALHDAPPKFNGEPLAGLCAHCNREIEIQFRQWLLCPVCERVLHSIGRSLVAGRKFLDTWEAEIERTNPRLELAEIDQPRLRARGRATNTDKEVAADFIIRRDGTPMVGIELKTGKSRIGMGRGVGSAMRRFQLDVSDCDDIERASRELGCPIYVVHSQVIDRASPPSVRYVPIEEWWTTPSALAEAFLTRSQRQRESKEAAYFDVRAFRPFADLSAHIASGGLDESVERFRTTGVPPLYK